MMLLPKRKRDVVSSSKVPNYSGFCASQSSWSGHSDSDGAASLKCVLVSCHSTDPSPSFSRLSEVENRMASKLVSFMNEFVIGVNFSKRLRKKADEAPSARWMLAARLEIERSNNSILNRQVANLSAKCRKLELNENLLEDKIVQLKNAREHLALTESLPPYFSEIGASSRGYVASTVGVDTGRGKSILSDSDQSSEESD